MLKESLVLATTVTALSASINISAQSTREYISIVGSSTVYPFATVVAEQFGRSTDFKTPKVESTGSGGGLKLFCAGVSVDDPDITNSSRRIKKSEFEMCQSNGIKDIIEIKVGYDGIAIANSKKAEQISLQLRDIYLALAKDVPDPNGAKKVVPNPYRSWKEVNPELPDMAIEVLGPPPTSGTRDAFAELALEGGCKTFDWIKAIKKEDKKKYKSICHAIREDGTYIEAGENDNLIVQKLEANPKALGVFGYSFLDQNTDYVQGSLINGVAPEFDTISDGSYPVSRPLYFYVKKAHVDVVPGIREYLAEFASEKAWGDEGYLTDRGLIPMDTDERSSFALDAASLNALDGNAL